jgi:hypothetical protein
MSIDNTQIVDLIGTSRDGTEVTLTISDHLEWGDNSHLLLLQEKLNTYVRFIESGEIHTTYPTARDKALRINVVCKYPPDDKGQWFLSKARKMVTDVGLDLTYEILRA